MSNVSHMIDYAPVRCGDHKELIRWLRLWADNIESGMSAKSLCLVVEDDDGQLGIISQSTDELDTARLVGLLHMAMNQRAEGDARIEDLLEGWE